MGFETAAVEHTQGKKGLFESSLWDLKLVAIEGSDYGILGLKAPYGI